MYGHMPELRDPTNGQEMKERKYTMIHCKKVLLRRQPGLMLYNTTNDLATTTEVTWRRRQQQQDTSALNVGCFMCHTTNGFLNHCAP